MGQVVDFLYILILEEVVEISGSYIDYSLKLCRKSLNDEGPSGSDMERILMSRGSG